QRCVLDVSLSTRISVVMLRTCFGRTSRATSPVASAVSSVGLWTRVGNGTSRPVRWLGGRDTRRPRWVASASDGWEDLLAGIRVVAGRFRDDVHMAADVTAEVEHRVGARDGRHGNGGDATGGAHWDGQSIRL